MYLNFSDIPGHQNLYLDFLYEFENVETYFKKNFRDSAIYNDHFSDVANNFKINRNELERIIQNQYKDFQPSIQTQNNIEQLSNKKTLAVVTGQQLGIFGGPLYTFYKIITAIKLAANLKEKYDYNFVPVFWLEGDDHDLDEVSCIKLLDDENELKSFRYIHNYDEEFINRESVGKIEFKNNISDIIDEINDFLRDTEFKPRIISLLNSFYKEGATFKQAFKNLIFTLFDEYGLIIFDPQDKDIKNLLRPIFKNEIENFRDHTTEVVKISAQLEEVYHAQVKVNPINLFFYDDDGRYLIEPVESRDEFKLKGKRKKFSRKEIIDLINYSPDKFSPNVLLRPICQDFILPTALYIGGPGEISYFAQVIPLYKFFNIISPIIYPRSSITIAEKSIKKVSEKYDLNYKNYFTEKEELIEKIINQISEFDINYEFDQIEKLISNKLNESVNKFVIIDSTLKDVTEKTKQQMVQNLNRLNDKVNNAQKKRHEIALRQINKAYNLMFPDFNLQERELNFIHFVNKYGLDILKLLMSDISINKFEHQIIEV